MNKIEEEKVEIKQEKKIYRVLDNKNKQKKVRKSKNKSFSSSEVGILLILTMLVTTLMTTILLREDIDYTLDEGLNKFIDNYYYILDNHYENINPEDIIDSAIDGMLDGIEDPYADYMDEDESDTFNKELDGSYEGLGVEISNTEIDGTKYVIIVTVFDDSPAQKAGLEAGDLILSIDDVELINVDTVELVNYVSDSEKSDFVIEYKRDENTYETTATRELVILESVTSEVIEKNNQKVGYIYIEIFAANTHTQLQEKLKELEEQNIDSLIIDVRGNSGGHLSTALYTSSLFLDDSKIAYQLQTKEDLEIYYSVNNTLYNKEVIILIDGGSASASELFTAALKENGVATTLGTTTYGKGTVQELVSLEDGTQYKITTKEWLTPNGNSINEVGIVPDTEIEFDFETYIKNPSNETDNQLQEALNKITQ